jgi:glycosyltransferase involved in cell wall biosynthesis
MTFSLIIPVYRNLDSLPALLADLEECNRAIDGELEAVFVVDGSPDESFGFLQGALPRAAFASQPIDLSRNFGSFAAIREGLTRARGRFFANRAADLQEPASLYLRIFEVLKSDEADIVLAVRQGRADGWMNWLSSSLFWSIYRRLVQRDMPPGGIDVFGCTDAVRQRLIALSERNSSLVGLVVWLGYRRRTVDYRRLPRAHGRSAWSFRRRLAYMFDSLFSFTDAPIRLLTAAGVLGIGTSLGLGIVVLAARLSGEIDVPGYSALAVLILFFGAANLLGLGIIGSYVSRIFENSKGRPQAIVMRHLEFGGHSAGGR